MSSRVGGPFMFQAGLWREDDPATRHAIRETYRIERRYGASRFEARQAAKAASTVISRYRRHADHCQGTFDALMEAT